ncbi:MAG TPA: lipopolysaccharide biosynthesis protein [Sphingobacteriaceae bacterium]
MSQENYPYEPEFSFKQMLNKRKDDLAYLWSKRLILAGIGIAGALLGILYAWQKPVTYTSRLTFVVEEGKTGGGSLLSGLAGQLGFDFGGISGSGGVLAGDNVQQLLKSSKMIKNTLLTPLDNNSKLSLADEYARTSDLSDNWSKKYNNGKAIHFPLEVEKHNRLQDSLMKVIIKRITETELAVGKPDKKMSFFELAVTMRNETVAKLFTQRLIGEATRFYIDTKTKRQRNNVNRLQARADSIGRLLNRKTYSAAESNSIMLDVNPAYPTANVGVELKQRDKMVLQTIYAEIVKNLEISRTMLIQETPTFQVVDEPELPLTKNRLGYLKAMVYGMLITGFIGAIVLLARK